jgi:hypothetical protein
MAKLVGVYGKASTGGALQVVEQYALVQSLAAEQVLPFGQRGQLVEPPQSTSLSPPFLTLSPQPGDWQMPLTHRARLQSELAVHPRPSTHFGQPPPPQSLAVSVPFVTPSVQVAALHTPPVHTLLPQSLAVPQAMPATHGEHEPPQSVSLSVPFFVWSEHDAVWQTPLVHKRL